MWKFVPGHCYPDREESQGDRPPIAIREMRHEAIQALFGRVTYNFNELPTR